METLKQIKSDFDKDAASLDAAALRLKYLGRKSKLSRLLRSLKNLPVVERKILGAAANALRLEIERFVQKNIPAAGPSAAESDLDVTLPGKQPLVGAVHPITLVERELRRIFYHMGFVSADGPEIETDYYNFEALNIPKGHPARDMQDTYYIAETADRPKLKFGTLILRTHISPMQIRVMKKNRPPLAVISAGRVFRHEATDARHEHTWDYMEGFMVGENIGLANLKYTLDAALKGFFGRQIRTKLRPSYFPFVEPGVEVAMSCVFCNGTGCRVCGGGWLEILGAGMIHPNLFKTAGYPPKKYTGFAFGLGLSRFALMKYDIPDIRLLYKNDLRYYVD